MLEGLLTTKQAADLACELGRRVSPRTLENYRTVRGGGSGPEIVKIASIVRYEPHVIERWAQEQPGKSVTSK